MGWEYGELSQAIRRLEFVIPFSLVMIAAVLYGATYSWIGTFIIMAQVPVACLGGILALLVSGMPFSVSAAVGFISIFGIAVMDGILLSTYPSALGPGPSIRRIHHHGFRPAASRDHDDRPRRCGGITAGGAVHADRSTDPEAARGRSNWRCTRDRSANSRTSASPHLPVPSPVAIGGQPRCTDHLTASPTRVREGSCAFEPAFRCRAPSYFERCRCFVSHELETSTTERASQAA
jgi:AcrB/AcrD/AcrF family